MILCGKNFVHVYYKFDAVAKQLAGKTILLYGHDFEKNGALHEYYEPDTG
jgi:hypothetical protein